MTFVGSLALVSGVTSIRALVVRLSSDSTYIVEAQCERENHS